MGKYIYLLDAFLDLEEDRKKGTFNPLLQSGQPSVADGIVHILDGTMREAVIEFEKLPLEQDLPILRNILYEGVRLRLTKALQKREERGEHDV